MSVLAKAHLIIVGRVQGVFYRAFTQEVAFSLDLKGWVRNVPDGNVEAVFEGPKEKIEQAIGKCYKGPPASSVFNIDVTWEDYSGRYNSFSIRY